MFNTARLIGTGFARLWQWWLNWLDFLGRGRLVRALQQSIVERNALIEELERYRGHLEEIVVERTDRLVRSEAHMNAMFRTMLEALAHTDGRGILLMVNDALVVMFGYGSAQELIGRNVNVLMPKPDRSLHDGYLARYLSSHAPHIVGHRRELTAQRKDGSLFPMELSVNELTLDGETTFIGVMTDITDRRAIEIERESARYEAERLARVKGEFLANMSHEIRTPLNAVIGLARIGTRENHGRKAGETCSRILEAGTHLLGVINDILDFSKIEAGKLTLEYQPIALPTVLNDLMGYFTENAAAKSITLRLSLTPVLPDWVVGDVLRIRQILTNLMSNALKFTQQGEVSLSVTREGDTTAFCVTDTGIGLTSEQIQRLFRAFEQADGSTTREFGGTGLGLVISRSLARLMGGDIDVASVPGQGSAFTLRLSLPEVCALPTRRASQGSGARLSGLRILAAEDVELNRMVLEDILTQEGAQVVFAENGQQVLDRVSERGTAVFDCVLMDVQMPVMDGLEATRRLRTLWPGLPVIGLTAHALDSERMRCLNAGMVAHVTKPVEPDTLVAIILQHVMDSPVSAAAQAPVAVSQDAEILGDAGSEIDWAGLLERFNGRQAFIDKLLDTVCQSQRETPATLRDAAQRGDLDALAFAAHAVKGMAGNIRAHNLLGLARQVEEGARAGSREVAPLAIALAGKLEALLASLAARKGSA